MLLDRRRVRWRWRAVRSSLDVDSIFGSMSPSCSTCRPSGRSFLLAPCPVSWRCRSWSSTCRLRSPAFSGKTTSGCRSNCWIVVVRHRAKMSGCWIRRASSFSAASFAGLALCTSPRAFISSWISADSERRDGRGHFAGRAGGGVVGRVVRHLPTLGDSILNISRWSVCLIVIAFVVRGGDRPGESIVRSICVATSCR